MYLKTVGTTYMILFSIFDILLYSFHTVIHSTNKSYLNVFYNFTREIRPFSLPTIAQLDFFSHGKLKYVPLGNNSWEKF